MQRELHYSSLATGSSPGTADSAREYAPAKLPCRSMLERVVAYVFLMCLAAFAFSAPVTAAVCRVTTAGSAAGSGTWASPMGLQTALMNTACTEVWVAADTYKPTTGTDRSISFAVRPSVAVYGGFAGGGVSA